MAYADPGFHVSIRTNNGTEALNRSLKHLYLKLTSVGSLTSLVDALVVEFIPDHLNQFAFNNYRLSREYKRWDERIPEWMHEKPKDVVKHLFSKMIAADNFTKSDIKIIDDSTFEVKSETSQLDYVVHLGTGEKLPSCQCPDFQMTFMLCKHFFAVFKFTGHSWDSLSELYKSSPYLSLCPLFLSEAVVESLKAAEVTSRFLDADDNTGLMELDDKISVDTPMPSIEAARKECRALLKEAENLTYDCQSVDAVMKATLLVRDARSLLSDGVPTVKGLPVASESEQVVQIKPTKNQTRQLPMRKKKKARKGRRELSSMFKHYPATVFLEQL